MEVYEDAGDPGGNKRQAVQAGFLEEAALDSNLKGAQPTRQRERVPVSIPTFPGGTGSVFFCPGLSCSRRLANKPGREAMLLTSCSANCQLFTLKFPSLVPSHAHLEVSPTQKSLQGGDGDYGPRQEGRKSDSIEEGLPIPHPHI